MSPNLNNVFKDNLSAEGKKTHGWSQGYEYQSQVPCSILRMKGNFKNIQHGKIIATSHASRLFITHCM